MMVVGGTGAMELCMVFIPVSILLLAHAPIASSEPVNVALGKTKSIIAQYSCGKFGHETYNTLQDAHQFRYRRPTQSCPAFGTNGPKYPPEYMVDGNRDTYWQSISKSDAYHNGEWAQSEKDKELETVITIDLEQEFIAEQLIIILGNALTPQKIAVLKSLDGETYHDWIYGVSSLDQCLSFFGASTDRLPSTVDTPVCLFYSADDEYPGDTITFDLKSVPKELQEFQRIRYIQLKFYDMLFVFPFNTLANTYNHYAVQELQVMAECPCNGQQTDCQLNPTSNVYECVCGGNTKGRFCESCMDKFNQFEFELGVACRECNCFGHSTSCFYKQEVNDRNGSIDTSGIRQGGGVCLQCRHNTAGVNCEECITTYYRPSGRARTAENVCISCGCSPDGSTVNPDSGLVDCVMNDDEAREDGKVPGDCFCKQHVTGTKCDTCIEGYYNLDASHDQGCIECSCFTSGTVEGRTLCAIDATGQCDCKVNVEGRTCDVCKDGFYGLTAEDANGCKPCECNVGGAVDQVCNKVTGQCVCRSDNIDGRACDSVNVGFYYPGPHAIFEELEDSLGGFTVKSENQYTGFSGIGYVVASQEESFNILMSIPSNRRPSQSYIMIVRYRSPVGESTNAVVTLGAQPSDTTPMTLSLPVCTATWCQMNTGTSNLFQLNTFPILITLTVTSGNILLDKIVAMPLEYTTTKTLLSTTLPAGCNFIENIMPIGEEDAEKCRNALFTVTMRYWGSPLPCDCDVTGSDGALCDANGGQCNCRGGVVGRSCGTCAPDHYGFTADGCSECNCDGTSSSCDAVTGQCQCPDNTIGRQCDLCLPANWGWDRDTGCKECGCHAMGAAYPQCDENTGVCTCRTGVMGDKCDTCMDNFYQLGSQGCSPCACDTRGSLNLKCNQTSGDCDCKENSIGRQCDQCSNGTFGLDANNQGGCLACICMGITTDCASGNLKISMELFPLTNITESGGQPGLVLTDDNGTPSSTQINRETSDNGQTFVLSVTFEGGASPHFWAMPTELSSNLLDLYGTSITVAIKVVLVDSQISPVLQAFILTSYDEHLTTSFGDLADGFSRDVVFTLRESAWFKAGTSTQPTRSEFLKALSRTSQFLVPASVASGAHTTSITSLQFGIAGGTGVQAFTVEECVCGDAYSGKSCEDCAVGYKRASQELQEFFGECVPCVCNGHSSICHEETGACIDCLNNTVGSTCESCADGFYGDALGGTESDCQSCPCLQPRVVNSICSVNASNPNEIICSFCNEGYEGNLCDQCSASYYGNPETPGGTCSLCQCNGNADSCDSVTGICIDCKFNTVGNDCERCIDTFYGDATTQSCSECGCVESASTSLICENVAGQCPCHAGVGGRTCDQCLEGFWGYNNADFQGCQQCQCLLTGSQQAQCDPDTGGCTCKANTKGDLCDSCEDSFFGLPDKPCEACECDITGTVPGTVCHNVTGQCSCQPGVTGRQCNQCQPLFIEFSSEGCRACSSCQKALGDSMQTLQTTVTQYLQNAMTTFEVQDEDSRLQVLEEQLQQSLQQLGLTESDAVTVSDVTANITHQRTELLTKFQITNSEITDLQTDSSDLLVRSQNKATEETEMNGNSSLLVLQLTSLEREVNSELNYLRQYNKSAAELSARGEQVTSVTIDLSEETAAVNKLLSDVSNINNINEIISAIGEQHTNSSTHLSTVGTLMTDFTNVSVKVDELISNHREVSFRVAVVDNTLDKALAFKSDAEELLDAVDKTILSSVNRTTKANATLQNAAGALKRTREIYTGDAKTVITGDDVLPFPNGIENFDAGSKDLDNQLQAVSGLVTNTDERVGSAELHLVTLQTNFNALNSTFLTLPDIGRSAKDAIDNYQRVILSLNNSVSMAKTAEGLIAEVQTDITEESLDARRTLYTQEKNRSETLRDEMEQLDLMPQVLTANIETADVKLKKEVTDWANLDEKISNMSSEAEVLRNLHAGNSLIESVNLAVFNVETAERATDNIAVSVEGQRRVLDQKETELNAIKSQIEETNTLDTSVKAKLSQHQEDFTAFMTDVNKAKTETTQFLATTSSISNKIADLEEKLARAENLLTQLRQPMTFDGSLSIQVENSQVNTPQTYDHVSLNVKRDAGFTDGNIFFTENDQNAQELEIGLTESKVFFEFNVGTETVKVTNPYEICDDCWAQVQASRLGNIGYVTVTNIATGAVMSQDTKGLQGSASSTVTLTTPLYVGSLPQDTTITKVTNKQFQGCLNEMRYQHQAINLWSAAVANNQEPSCCQAPPTGPDVTMTTGASFSGFGFLSLRPPTVSSPRFALLNFEFRTFSVNGAMFFTSSPDSQTSLLICLVDGKVSYSVTIGDNSYTVESDGTFNNGQWVTVAASLSEDLMQLTVGLAVGGQPETKTLNVGAIDLSALDYQNLIVGAPTDPFKNGVSLDDGKNTLLANVNDKYFTGCMRNIDLDISPFESARRLSTTNDVITQSGVNPSQCPQNIVNGISFLTSSSYVKMAPGLQVQQTSSIEIKVVTRETQAILMFITATAPTRSLYVALFGGNVIVRYSQETSGMVTSTGTFVSDGEEHTIRIDTFTSRISLNVDGSVFEESTTTLSTPNLSFSSNVEVYLGGVPEGTVLSGRPVTMSLIGGITSLSINDQPVVLSQTAFDQYKDISLEGIGLVSALEATTPDSCGQTSSPVLLPLNDGALFDGSQSFDWTTTGELANFLAAGFTMKMIFASYKADGVLFYAADSLVAPNHYFTIFLFNGLVYVKMKTSLGVERTVKSTNTYNNALRYQLSVTRINDFLQLSLESGDDYSNTGVDPQTASTLTIPLNVGIFIGSNGNNELLRTPLPDAITSKEQLASFAGGLFSTSLDYGSATETLNFAQMNRNLFPAVPANVVYGVSMTGVSSYIHLDDQTLAANQEIMIDMRITSITQSALLFILYETSSKYIAVDYDQNKIYIHLSPSFQGVTDDTTLTAFVFPGTSVLCDGNAHALKFRFFSNKLITTVDSVNNERSVPVSHAIGSMTNAGFYIGGIQAVEAASLPNTFTRTSLAGCVEMISVKANGADEPTVYDPSQYANTSAGLTYGCPQ